MISATSVAIGIDGFEDHPRLEQPKLLERLVAETLHELRSFLFCPSGPPEAYAIQAGDGLTVVFVDENSRGWGFETVVRYLLRMHLWACRYYSDNPASSKADEGGCGQPAAEGDALRLRIGVDVGSVERLVAVEGHATLCGPAIASAQQVMSCADGGQILFSEEAYQEYWARRSVVELSIFGSRLTVQATELVDIYTQRQKPLRVSYVVPKGRENRCWVLPRPATRIVTAVEVGAYGDLMSREYGASVQAARRIAFVHGEGAWAFDPRTFRLWEYLTKKIESVWVIVTGVTEEDASEASEDGEAEGSTKPNAERQTEIDGWIVILDRMLREFRDADVRLVLSPEKSTYSVSYLDWECSGGRIDVFPTVAGMPRELGSKVTLYWNGQVASPIYRFYVKSLDGLRKTGREQPFCIQDR